MSVINKIQIAEEFFQKRQYRTQLSFMECMQFVERAMGDRRLRLMYELFAAPGQTACSTALDDARNAPVITLIDTDAYTGKKNDQIIIEAFDDFEIDKIMVEIFDGNENLIVSGEAMISKEENKWIYVAKHHQGASARSFIDFQLVKSFWLSGGYEINRLDEAVTITSFIRPRSVDNFVLNTHGGNLNRTEADGTTNTISKAIWTDAEKKKYFSGIDIVSYMGKKNNGEELSPKEQFVKQFETLLGKVKDNGTFVLAACHIGQGDIGKEMAKTLNALSGNRFTFMMNRATNRNNMRYGGAYNMYGTPIGGSESNNRNASSNSWLGIKPGGGLFFFKDVKINRDAGDPLEIVK